MRGWVLFKRSLPELTPDDYEIHRLMEDAEGCGVELTVVRPDLVDLVVTREDRRSILLEDSQVALPDFVLPRMGAGTNYFALAVIRHLERLGVTCLSSSSSIDTVKYKLYTLQILAEKGLPVPNTMLVRFPVNVELVERRIGFPVVVKTLYGSYGRGVFLSQDAAAFRELAQLIEATNPSANIILQEFVSDSYGRDVRVFVIGGRPVAAMERRASDGGFKANFSAGGTVRAIEPTPEMEWLACESARILGLDIAGVDLLFSGDHFRICEVNSSPGFRGLESCCGMSVPSEMFSYVRIRLGMAEGG